MADDRPERNGATAPEMPKRRGPLVISLVLVALVLLAGAVGAYLMLSSKSGSPAPPVIPDRGDAPDGTPTGYVDITGAPAPASIGHFSNSAPDGEPLHRDAGLVYLGSGAAKTSNVHPGGLYDDGFVIPWKFATLDSPNIVNGLAPCSNNRALVSVDLSRLPEKLASESAVINAYFDWDRNGRFDGNDGCADEWGVRNKQVPLETLRRDSGVAIPVTFDAGRQTMDFWMRVSISIGEEAESAPAPVTFKYGETEDTHFQDPALTRLVPSSDPPAETCASGPPAVLRARSKTLFALATGAPGSRPAIEGVTVTPVGPGGSGAKAGEMRSTLGIAPARSSTWVELNLPDQPGIRRGRVEFDLGTDRKACEFVQVGSEAFADAGLGPLTVARPPKASPSSSSSGAPQPALGGGSTASAAGGIVCPYRDLNGGETTLSALNDFSQSPGATLTVSTGPVAVEMTPEAQGARIALIAQTPAKSNASTYGAEVTETSQAGVTGVHLSCGGTVSGKLPPRVQPGEDSSAPGDNGPGPKDSAQPNVTFGAYKIKFSKKSDSCGSLPFKEEDLFQVRPAPKNQIEISRPATGNKSVGNLSAADNSFLATGQGTRKDGRVYIESYTGKFVGTNVSGNYELQEGECRATFSFEGTKT